MEAAETFCTHSALLQRGVTRSRREAPGKAAGLRLPTWQRCARPQGRTTCTLCSRSSKPPPGGARGLKRADPEAPPISPRAPGSGRGHLGLGRGLRRRDLLGAGLGGAYTRAGLVWRRGPRGLGDSNRVGRSLDTGRCRISGDKGVGGTHLEVEAGRAVIGRLQLGGGGAGSAIIRWMGGAIWRRGQR